jgi:hypothetical protein
MAPLKLIRVNTALDSSEFDWLDTREYGSKNACVRAAVRLAKAIELGDHEAVEDEKKFIKSLLRRN